MSVRKKSKPVSKTTAKKIATAGRVARRALKRASTNAKKDAKQDIDFDKLKKNPKMKKRQLNEYNLFMRRQLKAGKTFMQAVRLWKRLKSGKLPVRTKIRVKRVVVKSKPRIITKTRFVEKIETPERETIVVPDKKIVIIPREETIVVPEKIVTILNRN